MRCWGLQIAPLGGLTLVFNILMAPCFLKEEVSHLRSEIETDRVKVLVLPEALELESRLIDALQLEVMVAVEHTTAPFVMFTQ